MEWDSGDGKVLLGEGRSGERGAAAGLIFYEKSQFGFLIDKNH
jgi:hypothetical protein